MRTLQTFACSASANSMKRKRPLRLRRRLDCGQLSKTQGPHTAACPRPPRGSSAFAVVPGAPELGHCRFCSHLLTRIRPYSPASLPCCYLVAASGHVPRLDLPRLDRGRRHGIFFPFSPQIFLLFLVVQLIILQEARFHIGSTCTCLCLCFVVGVCAALCDSAGLRPLVRSVFVSSSVCSLLVKCIRSLARKLCRREQSTNQLHSVGIGYHLGR